MEKEKKATDPTFKRKNGGKDRETDLAQSDEKHEQILRKLIWSVL